MSRLFLTPEEHAANPPESWEVREAHWLPGFFELFTKDGRQLSDARQCGASRSCEQRKLFGPLVRLYERERKWFAGAPPEETLGWPQRA